ncbi:MAG: dienelactone hydrolase family protein [Candidatus Marinimicrobia bacterium]|jgi:phospholipase/carboxylesterase|nr:dienelactone hydrolase family protein [Candidatus Neomarinimicrobiota bacterium]MDP6966196.1 dienelactone hydrolase family protein [Candidatus Neomarinimicrobiota bacterium]|tara:strand:- start:807 stop:1451 length:645 start_codon:yes stop_codon:yes gene_type:complete
MIVETYQSSGSPARAIIGLHGWTGDEFSMQPVAKKLKIEESKWFMPRAPYDADTGNGYTWFSGSDEEGWRYQRTMDMMPRLLSEVAEEGFTAQETFLVGFSMGAGLALLTAAALPYAIGGVIAIAGFVKNPDFLASLMTDESKATPIVIIQGSEDDIVTPERSKATFELLQSLGYDVRYEEYDTGHKVPADAITLMRDFIKDEVPSMEKRVSMS